MSSFISWFASLETAHIVAVGVALIVGRFSLGQYVFNKDTLEIQKIYHERVFSLVAVIAGLVLGVTLALTARGHIVDTMNATLFRYDRKGSPTEFMVWFHIVFVSVLYAGAMYYLSVALSKWHARRLIARKRDLVRKYARKLAEKAVYVPLSGQK